MTKAYLAEAIATFSLVFIGAGAVVADAVTGGALGLVGIALAHGLVHAEDSFIVPPVSASLFPKTGRETAIEDG